MSTRWRPDTCDCELVFNNGPENPPDHIKHCVDHKEDNGLVVWSENQGKNRTLSILEDMGLDPLKVEWRFEKKGRGRRTFIFEIPTDSRIAPSDIEFDPRDINHIEITSD